MSRDLDQRRSRTAEGGGLFDTEAQAAGKVTNALPPEQLLTLLLTLIHGIAEADGQPAQREMLAVGIRRLTEPRDKP